MRKRMGLTLAFVSIAVMAIAAEAPKEKVFVDAVKRVVENLEDEDYQAFERLFTDVTKGLQPDELWRAALGVLEKFGNVQKVEFSELDEGSGGAFVKVYFEEATREMFVRLTDENKIRELTYVPPMNVD